MGTSPPNISGGTITNGSYPGIGSFSLATVGNALQLDYDVGHRPAAEFGLVGGRNGRFGRQRKLERPGHVGLWRRDCQLLTPIGPTMQAWGGERNGRFVYRIFGGRLGNGRYADLCGKFRTVRGQRRNFDRQPGPDGQSIGNPGSLVVLVRQRDLERQRRHLDRRRRHQRRRTGDCTNQERERRTLQLISAATYTGGTLIDSGTISLGGSNFLPVGGALVLSSSNIVQLNLNGNAQTVGALSGGAAESVVALGSGSALTFGDSTSQTFAGWIQGSGTVTKVGGGALYPDRREDFSGLLSIAGGTVSYGNEYNLAALGTALSLDNSATLNPTATVSNSRPVYLGPQGGIINVAAGATATFGGPISGPGTLTNAGSGSTLYLTNANNSFGGLILTAGTTNVAPGSLGNAASATVAYLGSAGTATLQFAADMTVANNILLPPTTGYGYFNIDTNGHHVTFTGNFTALPGGKRAGVREGGSRNPHARLPAGLDPRRRHQARQYECLWRHVGDCPVRAKWHDGIDQ